MYLGNFFIYFYLETENGKYNIQNWRIIFKKLKISKVKRLILCTFILLSHINQKNRTKPLSKNNSINLKYIFFEFKCTEFEYHIYVY